MRCIDTEWIIAVFADSLANYSGTDKCDSRDLILVASAVSSLRPTVQTQLFIAF